MDSIQTPFLSTTPLPPPLKKPPRKIPNTNICCKITPDSWTLSDGNNSSRPYKTHRKKPLSDDNARRIIKGKAQYLSVLRRNQGSHAQTPKWIQRTPQQMVQYLEDDRDGHLYGKHVVAAIRIVRNLASKPEGSYNMREVMGSFVTKLTFREMCIVLKEQKGWRQVQEFFGWMKLQLQYRPSIIVYTIVLRTYGQVGKINLAEQTFLEMLEAGCEPDEVACGTILCAYARWGRHKAMLSFYSAVQERRIVPSVAVYNFMLSSLQKKSRHEKVILLWEQMMNAGVDPNHFTYTVVICSYAKEGLVERAFEVFNKMKKSGFIPEEVTYSLLISLCAKHGNRDESLNLYGEMTYQGIVPSNYTCATLLTLYYRNGDYSKALSLLSEMEKNKVVADEVIYGIIIRIYGKLGLHDDAQKTFKDIEKLGLLNDEKTYVAMAQVHLNARRVEEALNVLELMRSRGILLSRFTYIVLLQCYCIKEDVACAEVTFQALLKTGDLDAASCKDMLNLYVRLGFVEKAKGFIVQLRKGLVQFDKELYMIAMKVYCKEGMFKDVRELIEEMTESALFNDNKFLQTFSMVQYGESRIVEKADKSLDTIDLPEKKISLKADYPLDALDQPNTLALEMLLSLYLGHGDARKSEHIMKFLLQSAGGLSAVSQLIRNFVREGDEYKAHALHAHTVKLGYRPADAATATLISFHGRLQQLQKAQEIFASVEESLVSAKPICRSMIDACIRCGEPDEAAAVYNGMVKKGIDIDAVTISILVNAMTSFGKHRESENIIQISLQEDIELDTVAYNTFIKAMLEAGKLHFASRIYEHMLSLGVTPSIQTYSTMISVYGRGRKLDKAIEMFNTACSSDIPLDEKAYSNMISYYGKSGKTQEASLLFTKMQEEGIKPGKVTYNIMINIYASVGLVHEAENLFQTMQRDACTPDSLTYLALIRAYTIGQKFQEAEETISTMQKTGISPSCAHFDILLSAFAKQGRLKDAERLYKEALSPDMACHRSMLRGYMDYGHVEEAISLFERIHESVEPDRFVWSAAVHLYRFAGDEIKAGNVLDSMNRFGIPFLNKLEVGSKTKAS